MKTLKFMLAAATAIGLASASQAAGPYDGSTDFESDTLDSSITESGNYWTVPSGAEAGDYTIVSGVPNALLRSPGATSKFTTTPAQVLQLEGGVDPLTRNIQATGASVDLTTAGDVYIDTLVKFTVTPAGDTVEVGANDKLMIYLKEMTNSVGEVTGTNLVVMAATFTAGGENDEGETVAESAVATSVVAQNTDGSLPVVTPGDWYRLTVTSKMVNNVLVFNVAINGATLKAPTALFTGNPDYTLFPSLKGSASSTLTCVGFAGSGAVDDLLFSTWDPMVSVVDFYLVLAGDVNNGLVGQTVAYSNAVAQGTLNPGTNTLQALSTDLTVSVDYTAAAGYTATWDNDNDPNNGVTASTYYTLTVKGLFPRTNTAGQDGSSTNPYEVATAEDVKVLQEAVNCGVYADKCFKLTGDIDMTGVTDFYGIGWFTSSDAYASLPPGVAAGTNVKFTGVFDGQGYTLSNVEIVRHNYAGIFNCIEGATIKDLVVSNVTFSGTCSEEGFAIVGNSYGDSVLENLTSAGTWPADMRHNSAGIAVRAQHNTLITNCVNYVNLTTTSKRLGGILAFSEDPATASDPGVRIYNCTNYGNLSSTDGTRGVAGILSRSEASSDKTTIGNCANFGTLTAGSSGYTGAIFGQLDSNTYRDDGGNTFLASANIVGDYKNKAVSNLFYAVDAGIDGMNYLTTVKPSDLAAGNTYTLLANVAASETPVFTLAAAGDTIAFDTVKGFTFAGTVDAAAGLTASSATSGNVTTWTAAAIQCTITFISGEGSTTNEQTVSWGDMVTPPTAAAVAGKTFSAWDSDVVSPAAGDATYTAVYTVDTYTITYLNGDGTPFTDWATSYTAPTSYTVADAVTLPTSSDVDLQVVGVSFGGWTNETGTVTGWAAGQTDNVTVYAKLDAVVAPTTGWVDDSSTIEANKSAATQYPDLASSALATADAKELTDWAKKNSIAFNDVAGDTTGTYTEAFLLNCAVADVATEKAAFKANISVAADGTVTVTTPDGKDYNGTLQLKGKAALTDATWTNVEAPSSSYKFYMYELSL